MECLKKTFLSIEKFINNFNRKKKKYTPYFKLLKSKKKSNLQSYKKSIYSIVNNQKLCYILHTIGIYNFVYENYKYFKKKKIISLLDKFFIFVKKRLFFVENIYLNLKKTNFNSYSLAIKSFKTKCKIRFIKNKIKTNYKKSMVNVFVKLSVIWIKLFVIIYRTYQKTNVYDKIKMSSKCTLITKKSPQSIGKKKNFELVFFLNFSFIKKFKKKNKNFSNIYNFIKNKVKFGSLHQYTKFTNLKKIQVTHWTADNYNISCEKIFKNSEYDTIQSKNANKSRLSYEYKRRFKTKDVCDMIFDYILFN